MNEYYYTDRYIQICSADTSITYTTFSPFTDCRTFCPIWVRWRKSAISYRKYCGGKQSTKVRVAKMATSNGRFAKNCWNFFFWGWHFVLNIICTFTSNWSIFECVFITFLWMKCAWCKKPTKCLLCYINVIFFEWVEHELHIFSLRLFISWSKFLEGSNSYVDFLILSFLKVSFFCQFKFKTKFANLRENNFLKK